MRGRAARLLTGLPGARGSLPPLPRPPSCVTSSRGRPDVHTRPTRAATLPSLGASRESSDFANRRSPRPRRRQGLCVQPWPRRERLSVRKQLQSASPRPRPESSSFDVLLVSSLPKSFRGGSQTSESAAFAGAGGSRPARRERERLGDVALSALRSLRRGHHPLGDAAPRAVRSRRLRPRWCGRRLVPLLSPLRGGAAPIPFKVLVLK